jgi:hypothetical protein
MKLSLKVSFNVSAILDIYKNGVHLYGNKNVFMKILISYKLEDN